MSPNFLTASIVALASIATMRDVLMPGTRAIRPHELVIEASPHFAQYEFFAAPVRGFSGSTKIAPGAPFTFSSKYGTRVWAFARGVEVPEQAFDFVPGATKVAAGALAVGDIPVVEVSSAPIGSPLEGVTTHLRIASISSGVIRLEVVEAQRAWSWGAVAFALGGATLGVLGLVALARRGKRRAHAS